MILRTAVDFANKHYPDVDIWIYSTSDRAINLAGTEPELTDTDWINHDPNSVIRLAPYRAHMHWFDTLIHLPPRNLFSMEETDENGAIPYSDTS